MASAESQEAEIKSTKSTLCRTRLLSNFEKVNLDEHTIKDPEDRVHVKFIDNVKGKGLFASRKIEKGELIAFYRGEQITEEQFIEKQINDKEYVFFNRHYNIYIDAKNSEAYARYINDSEKPNAVARAHKDKQGRHHIKIVALNTIDTDEEITYSYGGDYLPRRNKDALDFPERKRGQN